MAIIMVAVVRPFNPNQVSEYLGPRTWKIAVEIDTKNCGTTMSPSDSVYNEYAYLSNNQEGVRPIDGK
jgi:hypothetical protein